jgi:hypothetical protein
MERRSDVVSGGTDREVGAALVVVVVLALVVGLLLWHPWQQTATTHENTTVITPSAPNAGANAGAGSSSGTSR